MRQALLDQLSDHRLLSDDSLSPSSCRSFAAPPLSHPCLLSLLQPVRHCLLPFLDDVSAAQLLRTRRSTATDLLSGFVFTEHVFRPRTAAALKHTVAWYGRYGMRITRLCLPKDWSEPLQDAETGQSLLPASLLAITIGESPSRTDLSAMHACAAYASFDDSDDEERGGSVEAEGLAGNEADFWRRIKPVNSIYGEDQSWTVEQYWPMHCLFNHPLPIGVLPRGLRLLHFGQLFNQPLSRGSIPDTVQLIQFGERFNQPLAVGHLPSSLTHLVFAKCFNQPLTAGVLPAGLKRLRFGHSYDQPLALGSLPPQLQKLSFGFWYNQMIAPGVIPSSVTHIRLGDALNHPLQAGSIPLGCMHLHLSHYFNRALPAGVLPNTLRELALSPSFAHPLEVGSLPDGLQTLLFHQWSDFQHVFLPGVIPDSVLVVSLGTRYEQELVVGSIPASVKWIRLPQSYAEKDLSSVLSPSTRVVWWDK